MGGHQVLALIPRSSSLFGGARNFFCLTPELIQLALGILQVPRMKVIEALIAAVATLDNAIYQSVCTPETT